MKNYKDSVFLFISLVLFFTGLFVIVRSDMWGLGSETSMNLAGSILSVFSGLLFLLLFFKISFINKKE